MKGVLLESWRKVSLLLDINQEKTTFLLLLNIRVVRMWCLDLVG